MSSAEAGYSAFVYTAILAIDNVMFAMDRLLQYNPQAGVFKK
jgi:hypothetical protein